MGLYQSFQQVFVTNSPALLAEGQTVDNLAIGQVGFLDGKTYKAVTAPTYAKNKALFAVWGTPDINLGDFGSAPNENEYSKLIKGKRIKRFRAKSAQRPQTPLYTLGWSGDVADNDTLFAKVGESKDVFIQLSGSVIDRLQDRTGLLRQFKTMPGCVDTCIDASCTNINPVQMTLDLVKQINSDKFMKQYIRAKALISCVGAVAPVEATGYKFQLSVCDTGNARALGVVQSQYPSDKVTLLSRDGSFSTYSVLRDANTAPVNFTSTGVFIPDCATCPAGYTFIDKAKVFQVTGPEGTTVVQVAAAYTGETSVTQISAGPQVNVFNVTFPVATTDASVDASSVLAGYVSVLIGTQANICQQTAPVSTAWSVGPTVKRQSKAFRITLADSVCGVNRLADLQAAYPALVVSVVNVAGACVHTYETNTNSNYYEVGCAQEQVVFVPPATFEGAAWKEVVVPVDPLQVCKTGIQFETSFFSKITNECSFDAFSYENDVVHVQVSNYNPNFNAEPCETEWVFKKIRGVIYPRGNGDYVRRLEQKSKMYDHRYRSTTPSLRDIEGYSFQADASKYYDEYVLEFDTKFFTSGGWSEQYTQSFSLSIFVPEGTGQALKNTLNSYISSAGIEEDGAAI